MYTCKFILLEFNGFMVLLLALNIWWTEIITLIGLQLEVLLVCRLNA